MILTRLFSSENSILYVIVFYKGWIVLLKVSRFNYYRPIHRSLAPTKTESIHKYVQKYVQTRSNSVICLMLGGFFMAEAMQKVGLDKTIFRLTISKFGTKPRFVLLGIMLVTAVFSMIMSNTAIFAGVFLLLTLLAHAT